MIFIRKKIQPINQIKGFPINRTILIDITDNCSADFIEHDGVITNHEVHVFLHFSLQVECGLIVADQVLVVKRSGLGQSVPVDPRELLLEYYKER